MLKRLLLFLLLSSTNLFGQSATTSQSKPLNDDEKRQILGQLYSYLDILKKTLPQYEAEVTKLQQAVIDERIARDQALMTEKKMTEAAVLERDSYKAKLEFCQSATKATKKGKSFGCILAKIFTLGLAGCH